MIQQRRDDTLALVAKALEARKGRALNRDVRLEKSVEMDATSLQKIRVRSSSVRHALLVAKWEREHPHQTKPRALISWFLQPAMKSL